MSHKEEAEMTTIDHQHAARTAVMNSIRQIEPNLYQNPHNPERYYDGLADDMLAAATPHLRAAWEEDLAERVRLWKAGALDVMDPDEPDPEQEGYIIGLTAILALLEGGGE